jgi:hypothetical protein
MRLACIVLMQPLHRSLAFLARPVASLAVFQYPVDVYDAARPILRSLLRSNLNSLASSCYRCFCRF